MTATIKQGAPIAKEIISFQPINREGRRTLIIAEDGNLGFKMYSGKNHRVCANDDDATLIAIYPGYIPATVDGKTIYADGDTPGFEMSDADYALFQAALNS